MIPKYFKEYPKDPEEVNASNAIARLIDGLGFRLYWASYGLHEKDCEYRVCDGAKSIYEIIWHVFGLVNWVYMHIYGHQMTRPKNIIAQGVEILHALETLRDKFFTMTDEELQHYTLEDMPFWSYINMPLSDALSHVGQISLLRRATGNPNKMDEYFKEKTAS